MFKNALLLLILFQSLALTSLAQDDPPVVEEADTTVYEETGDEPLPGKINFLENYEVAPGDTFIQRKIPDERIKELKADDDFWYANKKLVKIESRQNTPLWLRSWFQTLLWMLIIAGFAGFLIWYLAGSQVNLFRRKQRLIEAESEEDVGLENIFGINYGKEIDKATREGNYRLAVRLLFLRLLKQLSDKNLIQYKQDKTNLEYLKQLRSSEMYRDFFEVTRNYEYSWYGKFYVSEDAYKKIRKDFEKFDKVLF